MKIYTNHGEIYETHSFKQLFNLQQLSKFEKQKEYFRHSFKRTLMDSKL